MLPSVALSLAVEMLRDGGSLCASFQGANGAEYWLILPIQPEIVRKDGSVVRKYGSPLVVERPFAPEELQ